MHISGPRAGIIYRITVGAQACLPPDDEIGIGRYKADPTPLQCYRACTSGGAYVLQTPLRVVVRYDNVRAQRTQS